MAPNPISLHLKSPIFSRLFASSSRPISNSRKKFQLSLNPVQFTGFKACSSCNSFSHPLSFSRGIGILNDWGWQLNADRICTSAVSGGGYGGAGGFGGSGDGSSGGGGETGDDNSGGKNWYLETLAMFAAMINFLTPALLNCIGDLFRQLVIEEASCVDVQRTLISTSLGLPVVGHTLRFWLFVDREISAFCRSLLHYFLGLACIFLVVVVCCIRVLIVAFDVVMRNRALGDDINSLPKYRYCHIDDNRLRPIDDDMNRELIDTNLSNDSDCCICLGGYEDGVELNILPCKHHFHCGCISKWLWIKPTCPVCNCSILRKADDSNPQVNSYF